MIGHKPSQGFPRGEDPSRLLLERGHAVRIVQDPRSELKKEELHEGFKKLNKRREIWLRDLKAGYFSLELIEPAGEKVDVVNNADEEDAGPANLSRVDDVDDGQLNFGDSDSGSEWGGIVDDSDSDI